jgi:hypothetical protein
MNNLLSYNNFEKVNEGLDVMNILREKFYNIYKKISNILKKFKNAFKNAKNTVEENLSDYSLESIREFCFKFGLSFNIFQQLYGVREEFGFKKLLALPILALLLLSSCEDSDTEALIGDDTGKGGTKEIYLEIGKKLMDVDMVSHYGEASEIWTLTRDMTEGDEAETYEYKTTHENGKIFIVKIIETAGRW